MAVTVFENFPLFENFLCKMAKSILKKR